MRLVLLLSLLGACFGGTQHPGGLGGNVQGGGSGSLPGGGPRKYGDGGQLTNAGLYKVSHDGTLSGDGRPSNPLAVVGGGGGGTVTNVATGTGLTGGPVTTTGTISIANTAVTPGPYTLSGITVNAQGQLTAASSYAGTTAPADKAITALSAAGAGTFAYFYDSPGTGLATGATANIVKIADTAVTPASYTYSSITVNQQGQITAASNGATPALASTTISAGTMLSGGGDLSANRTINLADIATSTVIGRVAGGTGAPSALTTTQLTTLVNTFSSSLSGAVPASGGGTTTYLRADGSFATPPGTNTLTNSAGNNVIPKSNGTNLVASSVSDNGTTVSTLEALQVGGSSASTASVINVAGSGLPTSTSGGVAGSFYVVQPSSNNGLVVARAAVDATGGKVTIYKTRNADASVKTAVVNADELGRLSFQAASDGTTVVESATVTAVADAAVSSSIVPTELRLRTMTTGGTLTTALTLGNDQSATFAASGTFATTLGVTGLSTLTGGFTAGAASGVNSTLYSNAFTIKNGNALVLNNAANSANAQVYFDGTEFAFDHQADMASHKITSLSNGSASSDAAAFGQLATAVNAAVSGVAGRVGVFSATNAMTGYANFTANSSGDVIVKSLTATPDSSTNYVLISTGWGGDNTKMYMAGGGTVGTAIIGLGGSDVFDCASASGGLCTSNVAFKAAGTAHIAGALTEDSTITEGVALTAGTFTLTAGYQNVTLKDTETAAIGVGAALELDGAYTGTTTTGAALIKAMKSNSIAGDYGFDLVLGARLNGVADVPQDLIIASSGVVTMKAQGLGVGGLYEGTVQDVADVFNSGTIRKNLAYYSDDLETGTLVKDATWGPLNGTSTTTYATSTAVSPPWGTSTITPAGGGIGKITCANGGSNCSAYSSQHEFDATSTTTGITDLRSKTFTFSVWIQAVSGTLSAVEIGMGRYSGNDTGVVVCPPTTAGTWVRCSLTRTFSATSYTDNSEIYTIVMVGAAASLYVAGAQVELGSVPTPYEPNDAHVYRGSEGYKNAGALLDGISLTTTTLTSATDPGPGGWAYTFGVGNTKENPNAGFASNGSMFATYGYVTNNYMALGGLLTGVSSNTNYGEVYYDPTPHTLYLLGDNHAGTSTIAFQTSNSAHAATQMSITSALVAITPLTQIGGGADNNGCNCSTDLYVTNNGATNLAVRDSTNNVEAMVYVDSTGTYFGSWTNHALHLEVNNANQVVIDTTSATFTPAIVASSTKNKGTITLSSGTGTATVTSGSQCACSDTTATNVVKCAVATTTLTATGIGSDVISYVCM